MQCKEHLPDIHDPLNLLGKSLWSRMWLMVNLEPLTLGPWSGGVSITTEMATPHSTRRMTPMAMVIPFQFLSLDVAPTSS